MVADLISDDVPKIDNTLVTKPCFDRIRVEKDGTWIADSVRAIVLHEARLPPLIYIPMEDVRPEYLAKTETQTHCPFKGNASYWSLQVGGQVTDDAMWGYEDPYADGESLRGYVAFDHSKIDAIYRGADIVIPESYEGAAYANPLVGWVIGPALVPASVKELFESFVDALQDAEIPASRVVTIIPNLHPQIFASMLAWSVGDEKIEERNAPHDILSRPVFADSPFAPILRGSGGIRRRLEGADVKLDYPILVDLHKEGATDYCAMPFRFTDGQICIITVTSFRPGGFPAEDLNKIYEILPSLGRLFEVHIQRRTAIGLLETYLGGQTGRRVLNGQIKHGDGEHIHAVIWFSDFRDSTALSQSMEQDVYLEHLNRYFECVAGSVIENGGEVLRFIGDAVLAIFPISDAAETIRTDTTGTAEACRRAMKASQQVAERIDTTNEEHADNFPPIRYGIGLHLGDVTYGNIGIPERLEFTVIGLAANQAARVESLTKELKETVLVSEPFADQYAGALTSVGKHVLKGVPGEHELFIPDAMPVVDEPEAPAEDEDKETVPVGEGPGTRYFVAGRGAQPEGAAPDEGKEAVQVNLGAGTRYLPGDEKADVAASESAAD
jgi:adenylate cyclase